MYISTNIFCSRDYVYDTNHTNERRYFDTCEIILENTEKRSRSDYERLHIRFNERKCDTWYVQLLSCEKVSVMTCAKMYVARPISFDDRQYRLINSRTLSF